MTEVMDFISRVSGVKAAAMTAGSQEKLAEMVGVSPQAVSLWIKKGYVPDNRVFHVSRVTGVPPQKLMRAKQEGASCR